MKRTQLRLTLSTLGLLLSGSTLAQNQALEDPPVFEAEELLAADQLRGPHHQVETRVENDGAFNHFTVRSDFGTFEAPSEMDLEILLSEIEGIATLEELSRRKVFADALADAARKPIDAVTSLVEDPQGALEELPKGLARTAKGLYFRARKTVYDVKKTAGEIDDKLDERREQKNGDGDRTPDGSDGDVTDRSDRTGEVLQKAGDLVERKVGYTSARRRLAQRVGVDPYTRNPELNQRLDRLARAAFLSELGFGQVMPDIRLVGLSEDLASLIWEVPREELQRLNDQELGKMGVAKKTRFDLFDNKSFSPTEEMLLVRSLQSMDSVEGRDAFVELAAAADTPQRGRFFARAAQLLARVHEQEPLSRLRVLADEQHGQLVFATSQEGATIVPAPVDHLTYREGMEPGGTLDALEDKELWVTGTVSDRTRSELEGRSWRIVERALETSK